MERQGRGAWPKDGRGGTLNVKGDGSGKYYTLAKNPLDQVGLGTLCRRMQDRPVTRDYNATFHGVVAIQVLLAGFDVKLSGDGVYGPDTYNGVKKAQATLGIISDGIVGPETMTFLLWPHIHDIAKAKDVPWNVIFGFLKNEGAWDPGAVGWYDNNDLGLAQINLTSHPDISESDALCPSFAMNFIADYIRNALDQLDGNIIDSVISYNLGIGGTRQWIRDGRPLTWTPPWSNLERRPFQYADRILNPQN